MAMENIKFRDMKKLLFFIILVSCVSSCQEINKTKGKTVNMTNEMKEKFDINKYNKEIEYKEKLNDINLSLSDYQEKKEDGTIIRYGRAIFDGKRYYSKNIYPPPPALYFEAFEYDEKGNFLSKNTQFFGGCMGYDYIQSGNSYYANNDGTVTEVNEDEKYDAIKIKPNKLFEILQKEPLFLTLTKEEEEHFSYILQIDKKNISVENVCKSLQRKYLYEPNTAPGRKNIAVRLKDNKTWFIMKSLYPSGQIFIEMDANTGKIYKRKYKKETRP